MAESKRFEIKGFSVTLENKSPRNGQNPDENFTIKCVNPEILQEIINELKKRGTLYYDTNGETEMYTQGDNPRVSHDTMPFVTFKRAAEVLSLLERKAKEAGAKSSFALVEVQRAANPARDLADIALQCLDTMDISLTRAQKRKFREAFMEKCHRDGRGF